MKSEAWAYADKMVDGILREWGPKQAAQHLFNYHKLYGSQATMDYYEEVIELMCRNAICEAGYKARQQSGREGEE